MVLPIIGGAVLIGGGLGKIKSFTLLNKTLSKINNKQKS